MGLGGFPFHLAEIMLPQPRRSKLFLPVGQAAYFRRDERCESQIIGMPHCGLTDTVTGTKLRRLTVQGCEL
jgi:hypothetical protein